MIVAIKASVARMSRRVRASRGPTAKSRALCRPAWRIADAGYLLIGRRRFVFRRSRQPETLLSAATT
jgi:hypothetical protein